MDITPSQLHNKDTMNFTSMFVGLPVRYLLILSVVLFGCSKEDEVIFDNSYQLRTALFTAGYDQGTILWIKEINLSNEIILDINVDYAYKSNSNNKIYNIDFEKASDTTDLKVIFTFDCKTGNGERDMKPDYFDIKKEVLINFYKDKRTVVNVEASSFSNCNPIMEVYSE